MIKVITEKCTGCSLCIKSCAYDAITIVDKKAIIDLDKCTLCGACVSACPFNAIEITKAEKPEIDRSQYKGVFVFAEQNIRKRSLKILTVALGATMGAGLLTFFKGNLFSGSIAAISRSFANAQINLNALTSLFGEMNYGFLSRLILGSLEGFLFGGLLMIGFELFRNHQEEKESKQPINLP